MKQLIFLCFLGQLILTGIVFAQPSVEVSAVNTHPSSLDLVTRVEELLENAR